MENNEFKQMRLFLLEGLLLSLTNVISYYLFINRLVNTKKKFISLQVAYFIFKIIPFSLITIFFCFFSPSNRVKFILLSLGVFIIFHFIEAVVIQKQLDKKNN